MEDFIAERSDVKSHEGNRAWEVETEGAERQNRKFGRSCSGLGREVEGTFEESVGDPCFAGSSW